MHLKNAEDGKLENYNSSPFFHGPFFDVDIRLFFSILFTCDLRCDDVTQRRVADARFLAKFRTSEFGWETYIGDGAETKLGCAGFLVVRFYIYIYNIYIYIIYILILDD